MHLSATPLVVRTQRFNAIHKEPHHCLVANRTRQLFITHAADVSSSLTPLDTRIIRGSIVAKRLCESADLRPPFQRLHHIRRRQNGHRTLKHCFRLFSHELLFPQNSLVRLYHRRELRLEGLSSEVQPNPGNADNKSSRLIVVRRRCRAPEPRRNGPGSIEPDGPLSMKFGWYRGEKEHGELTNHGRGLDALAPPLRASIPDGYGHSGFQATGMIFRRKDVSGATFQSSAASFEGSTRLVQNNFGSAAGPSAIFSSSGYFARSGPGTFTFAS